MLNKLIKIANKLDQKGLYEEARVIDCILKHSMVEGPIDKNRYDRIVQEGKEWAEFDFTDPDRIRVLNESIEEALGGEGLHDLSNYELDLFVEAVFHYYKIGLIDHLKQYKSTI